MITGTQAAGKTSVAHHVALRFRRSAHVEADALTRMIVNGIPVLRPPRPRGAAAEYLALRAHQVATVANSFLAHGYTVVIDEIIDSKTLRVLAADIHHRPLYLAVLAPTLDVVQQRARTRSKTEPFLPWSPIADTILRRSLRGIGLWLDTSTMSPVAVASEILARIWEEGKLPG